MADGWQVEARGRDGKKLGDKLFSTETAADNAISTVKSSSGWVSLGRGIECRASEIAWIKKTLVKDSLPDT